MRISYVSDSIYPYNKGGKEKRLYEISIRLASMGHDVHIYTMKWWSSSEKVRVEDGVTLHAISKLYPLYKADRRSIKEGIFFSLACLKLIKEKLDIVDVDHMPFFPVYTIWLVCKLRHKKLFGTWHEALSLQDWKSYMGIGGYVASVIEGLSIKLPDHITAASMQTRDLLGQYHGRHNNVSLVGSGVDAQLISAIKPAANGYDVLFVGRLVKDKNVDLLIRAVDALRQRGLSVRCGIIGDGIERAALESMVRELHLQNNIFILGQLADITDVYAQMKAARVFVLPSSREGFGIVVLESLACDTPVVTVDSKANASRHLLDSSNKGLAVKLSSDAIADAIEEFMHRETTASLSESVANSDWLQISNLQEKVYSSC